MEEIQKSTYLYSASRFLRVTTIQLFKLLNRRSKSSAVLALEELTLFRMIARTSEKARGTEARRSSTRWRRFAAKGRGTEARVSALQEALQLNMAAHPHRTSSKLEVQPSKTRFSQSHSAKSFGPDCRGHVRSVVSGSGTASGARPHAAVGHNSHIHLEPPRPRRVGVASSAGAFESAYVMNLVFNATDPINNVCVAPLGLVWLLSGRRRQCIQTLATTFNKRVPSLPLKRLSTRD
ncbi:hypothetical protein C8F04DRAFT_1188691 [Mycena alexandri]|uniref:Uncharacterized protein n=1 Tax=Mycena alexandri TaxID=1745969 RepID=A0AAD6SK02_9AGAR|nr:hypothetical protein C8F04DRAFT_1188691 [Mycena alexandri]